MPHAEPTARLESLLRERILVIDGAMGTMIQAEGLAEADFRGERFGAVVGLGDARGAKRVGLDQVGARREIGVVDPADHVRAREHEDLVVAAQIARVIAEAIAAEVRLAEAARLDHRPHRAVDHEDPLGEDRLERVAGAFGLQCGPPGPAV